MATLASAPRERPRSLTADTYEKVLAVGSVLLGLAILAALLRGRAHWGEVPPLVWVHLLTIGVALALTPTLLLQVRGTRRHRLLGRTWAVAMLLTAALSLGIRGSGPSGWSVIHILSGAMLVMVPALWWSARRHQVASHRRRVRGVVTGALLIAGVFTFPFDRMLGHWLFG